MPKTTLAILNFKTKIMTNIPIVDLSDFTGSGVKKKAAFVQELGKAYEDVGFVAVKNH